MLQKSKPSNVPCCCTERATVTAGVTSDERKGVTPAWAKRTETARLFREGRATIAPEMEGLSK